MRSSPGQTWSKTRDLSGTPGGVCTRLAARQNYLFNCYIPTIYVTNWFAPRNSGPRHLPGNLCLWGNENPPNQNSKEESES